MSEQGDFKHIVRIANADLDGNKSILQSIRKIKGVGFMFANVICNVADVSKDKKTGTLTEKEIESLNSVIKDPKKFDIPIWMFNRRKDYEDGTDKHIISGDMGFVQSSDIKRLRMIKCYKGSRHAAGIPVRGQRTKSNFRKNKGTVTGVKRKSSSKGGRV